MDLQRSARRSLGNWRHPLLGRPIGSMVGSPRPWLPRGKRFGNRLPRLPSRSGSVFLAAAGSTWLPARPDTRLMVPAHAGLRPASLPTRDSNMPCTRPSELSGSYSCGGHCGVDCQSPWVYKSGVKSPLRPPPARPTTPRPSCAQILLIVHQVCHATPLRVAIPPSILRTGDVTGCVWPSGSPLLSPILLYRGGPQSGHPPSRKIIDSLIQSARGVH